MRERSSAARLAGALYLIYIGVHVLADLIGPPSMMVLTEAAQTAENVLESGWRFSLGLVVDLIAALLFFLAAWALYRLLRPVGGELALLFLLLNLAGVVMQCAGDLFFLAGRTAVSGEEFVAGFSAEQSRSLAMVYFHLREDAFMGAQIFYATWLLPLGFLVYRARFIPGFLGILLLVHGVVWFVTFLQHFLFPTFTAITFVSYPLGFLAEFGLGLWLLIAGARESR